MTVSARPIDYKKMSRSAHLEQMDREAVQFGRNFLLHLRCDLIDADQDPDIHRVVRITTNTY